jgi:molybdenum cofactor cytidylyltransferase
MLMVNEKKNKTAALILAAGYSSRMQGFKPLLPFGGAHLIDVVVDKFIRAGVDDIVVVYGYNGSEMREHLETLPVIPVENPAYADGMFTSVLAGVRKIDELQSGAFFVTPVDYPLLKSSTPALLTDAMGQGSADIAYPTYRGERGHPVLVNSRLIPGILTYNGFNGLYGALLSGGGGNFIEIETGDLGILLDMNTDDDYKRLLGRYENEKDILT